ncbi:hypothetical protein CLF_100118 [Clonorchis sinensis]|uniref:Uncharacterized protein n=1 Tax=Clonorchis sinensis TaxID=79923 RepID=G7Y2Q1_CLOSI|nr:hypothetical protein CLF_100118 [Clonorchis sinensis]
MEWMHYRCTACISDVTTNRSNRYACTRLTDGFTRGAPQKPVIIMLDLPQTCPSCRSSKYSNPQLKLMVNVYEAELEREAMLREQREREHEERRKELLKDSSNISTNMSASKPRDVMSKADTGRPLPSLLGDHFTDRNQYVQIRGSFVGLLLKMWNGLVNQEHVTDNDQPRVTDDWLQTSCHNWTWLDDRAFGGELTGSNFVKMSPNDFRRTTQNAETTVSKYFQSGVLLVNKCTVKTTISDVYVAVVTNDNTSTSNRGQFPIFCFPDVDATKNNRLRSIEIVFGLMLMRHLQVETIEVEKTDKTMVISVTQKIILILIIKSSGSSVDSFSDSSADFVGQTCVRANAATEDNPRTTTSSTTKTILNPHRLLRDALLAGYGGETRIKNANTSTSWKVENVKSTGESPKQKLVPLWPERIMGTIRCLGYRNTQGCENWCAYDLN